MIPKHVVLLTHDSWRADHVSPELTPHTWELAAQGARFDAAFATGSSTAFAFSGILASNYPSTFGVRIDPSVLTLDEQLQQHGFSTAALIENVIILHPYYGYYDHVDHYKFKDFLSDENEADPGVEANDKAVEEGFGVQRSRFGRVLEWAQARSQAYGLGHLERVGKDVRAMLGRGGAEEYALTGDLHTQYHRMCERWFSDASFERSRFVHMHTVMPHAAFWAPDDLLDEHGVTVRDMERAASLMRRGHVRTSDKRIMRNAYRASVAYSDRFIGSIVERLRARGVLDDTLLIVSADHGEQLYENGYFGHSKPLAVDDHVLRVPLVMRGPGIAPQVIDRPVSMIDLSPTIADLLGQARPSEWHGRSLRPILSGRPLDERAVITEAWQLADLLAVKELEESAYSSFTVRDDEFLLKIDIEDGTRRESVYRWRRDPSRRTGITETSEGRAAADRLRPMIEQKTVESRTIRTRMEKRRMFASAIAGHSP